MDIRNNRKRVAATGLALTGLTLLCAAPVWAVSLSTIGPAQPIPDDFARDSRDATNATEFALADLGAAGSSSLVPLMAADQPARVSAVTAVDAPANGGARIGKPIDDIQFVRQAAENGAAEILAAREALPQLKDPELRHLAEMLVNDHGGANERLSQLADSKGWPVPARVPATAPPSGTAASDFDARFTARMIAGHERSAALYRAQATGGEDKDLRKYAKDTLPTIEKHLAELRRLQK
jgi:putative membrane protein